MIAVGLALAWAQAMPAAGVRLVAPSNVVGYETGALANTRVITTVDEMLQDLINMKR